MSENIPIASPQAYIRSGIAQTLIVQTLGDGAKEFTLALLSVINANPVLQGADPVSIIKAGFEAAALGLPISNSTGLAYIIPYNNKKKDENGREYWSVEAQFQIGYKGFKQLAIQTEKYKTIHVSDVREGEYKGEDHLTGEYQFKWVKRKEVREKKPIIGYVAYFQLTTGYSKALYMTNDELYNHAKKYSKSYQKGYGKWVDDFDAMAKKTVIKLLISRDGLITSRLSRALEVDQSSMGDDDTYKYVDNEKKVQAEESDTTDEVSDE
jgi:recombination protein RecT